MTKARGGLLNVKRIHILYTNKSYSIVRLEALKPAFILHHLSVNRSNFMKSRAAVAFAKGEPLQIVEIDVAPPQVIQVM